MAIRTFDLCTKRTKLIFCVILRFREYTTVDKLATELKKVIDTRERG